MDGQCPIRVRTCRRTQMPSEKGSVAERGRMEAKVSIVMIYGDLCNLKLTEKAILLTA